jgi:hypothetical protein
MIFSSGAISAAKWWGQRKLARSTRPGERWSRTDDVVDLLAARTSPGAQSAARLLLHQMATTPWSVIRGAHPSKSDATQHVLVEIGGVRYHIRLDARDCVFDITHRVDEETERVSGRKPWVPPGG